MAAMSDCAISLWLSGMTFHGTVLGCGLAAGCGATFVTRVGRAPDAPFAACLPLVGVGVRVASLCVPGRSSIVVGGG